MAPNVVHQVISNQPLDERSIHLMGCTLLDVIGQKRRELLAPSHPARLQDAEITERFQIGESLFVAVMPAESGAAEPSGAAGTAKVRAMPDVASVTNCGWFGTNATSSSGSVGSTARGLPSAPRR